MTTFLVHFRDGAWFDIQAETPQQARRAAREFTPTGIVAKVKVKTEAA